MLDELAERAARLAPDGRAVLGITGCPGAGKSTLAERLVGALDPSSRWVARVPMDGFHLSDAALDRLGRRHRKGAIDTFDAYGYLSMLRRLRTELDHEVFVPNFERDLEQAIAGSLAVGPSVRLVITEGNYLLAATDPWPQIRAELAEVWYVDIDEATRRERLVARHVRFGKLEHDARGWVEDVDEVNARQIRATRERADLWVDMAVISPA
jgi:pantothenate kinase